MALTLLYALRARTTDLRKFNFVGKLGFFLSCIFMSVGSAYATPLVGGIAWEIVTGFVTAPSTTITAVTVGSGDSLQIRNAAGYLVTAWGDWQTAGYLKLSGAPFHNGRGLQWKGVASEVYPLMPMGMFNAFKSGDNITVGISGSGTGGDIESASLLICYPNFTRTKWSLSHVG